MSYVTHNANNSELEGSASQHQSLIQQWRYLHAKDFVMAVLEVATREVCQLDLDDTSVTDRAKYVPDGYCLR